MNYSINNPDQQFENQSSLFAGNHESFQATDDHYKEAKGVTIVQDGKFVFVNHALQEKLGCTDEIIGQPFLSFVHQESMLKIMMLMERIENGNTGQLMHGKFLRLNGSTLFAEFISFPILFKGEPAEYLKINEFYTEDEYNIRQSNSLKDRFYETIKKTDA